MRVVGIIMNKLPCRRFRRHGVSPSGKYGLDSLASLAKLRARRVSSRWARSSWSCSGRCCAWWALSLWRYLRYIRAEEILLVIGTSSSEPALPGMLAKLERLGCARPVVGLVLPTGYSFNLDGTCIYLTMAAVFIGASTFYRHAAHPPCSTLGIIRHSPAHLQGRRRGHGRRLCDAFRHAGKSTHVIPESGLSLIIGVPTAYMSEARAVTNLKIPATASSP